MTNFEYYWTHVIPTSLRHFRYTFKNWADLMTGNYKDYALLSSDDPFTECYGWFWSDLNDADIYPKEFLEYLHQLMDDVESGKEKLIPLDVNFFKDLEEEYPEIDWGNDMEENVISKDNES